MRQIGPSIIRTVAPWLAAILITWAAQHLGLTIPRGIGEEVVTAIVGSVYYGLARLAETRLGPIWGWMLGMPKAPTYDAPARPDEESPTGQVATEASDIPEGDPVEVIPGTTLPDLHGAGETGKGAVAADARAEVAADTETDGGDD